MAAQFVLDLPMTSTLTSELSTLWASFSVGKWVAVRVCILITLSNVALYLGLVHIVYQTIRGIEFKPCYIGDNPVDRWDKWVWDVFRTLVYWRLVIVFSAACCLVVGPAFLYALANQGDLATDLPMSLELVDSSTVIEMLGLEVALRCSLPSIGPLLSSYQAWWPWLLTPLMLHSSSALGPSEMTTSTGLSLPSAESILAHATRDAILPAIIGPVTPLTSCGILGAGADMPYLSKVIVSNPASPYIQYYMTPGLMAGHAALERMFMSLEAGTTLHDFIQTHCAHLHQPLKGDTPVPRAYLSASVLKSLSGTIQLGPTYYSSSGLLPSVPGVYAYTHELESVYPVYGGSSINMSMRSGSHFMSLKACIRHDGEGLALYKDVLSRTGGTMTGYNVSPVYVAPDYLAMYVAAGNTSPTALETQFLRCYTYQHLYAIEQAYSSEAQPYLFVNKDIGVPYRNWQVGYPTARGDIPVKWVTETGTPGFSPSINQAANVLHVVDGTILYNANCHSTSWVNTHLGRVSFTVDNYPWVDTPSDRKVLYPVQIDIDTANLDKGNYAFNEAYNRVVGPVTEQGDLLKQLGLGLSKTTYALFNKAVAIYAPALGSLVYLVSVVRPTYPVYMTNTSTGKRTTWDHATHALLSLFQGDRTNMPNMTTFAKRHLIMGNAYRHTDDVTYTFEYVDPAVRAKLHDGIKETSRKIRAKRAAS